MSSSAWRNPAHAGSPMSISVARPWTVTDSSSPGRCVALTCGRARMWRKRTESGAEPKWKAPRKKMPSTAPTIGRPSAVTVASASRRIPVSRPATSSALRRRSGVMIRRRCVPAAAWLRSSRSCRAASSSGVSCMAAHPTGWRAPAPRRSVRAVQSRRNAMPRTHHLPDEQAHFRWATGHEPVLQVSSGDTVVVWTRDVSDNQIGPDSDTSVIASLDWDRVYLLAGPIAVAGAQPGDTLAVEILDIHTQGWGWTAILPGLGLLPEDFPDAYLRVFDLSHGDVAYMRDDIAIPLEPFFGTMGVCPAGASAQPVMPPGRFGGNMDTRQLGRGATLYLPVEVEQALFSCGDAHGAQGDGEVCVTGLEAPMFAALRFTLEKGRTLPGPQYRTPAPLTGRVDSAPFYATTGVGGDLYRASQDAVRAMIDHLDAAYALGPEDAYLLCSLAVDLKISEIVDAGQYIVSALLPEAIFAGR